MNPLLIHKPENMESHFQVLMVIVPELKKKNNTEKVNKKNLAKVH